MEPSDGIRVFGLSGNLLAALDHKRMLSAGDFADVLKNYLQLETLGDGASEPSKSEAACFGGV